MDYHPHLRFETEHAISKYPVDTPSTWRCLHLEFKDLPEDLDQETLATRIYKVFKNLDGGFYFDPRTRMTVFCKMNQKIIIDDIIFKIKSLIKADFMCRIGEQYICDKGLLNLQFLFAPTSNEQQKLSHEFIVQERLNRQNDVIMIVEDDLFARNIAVGALKNKFKVIEVSDGGKAVQEYLSHSPDVVFLDIHLPNKNGDKILKEIMDLDPQAYIIMLSADAAKDRVVNCIDVGAKGFIAKPFQGDKLLGYIRKCPTIRIYC